jgi:hypothetical protein
MDLNTGREYALMGLANGVAVVDITNPEAPQQIGAANGTTTTWRDMKVYQIRTRRASRSAMLDKPRRCGRWRLHSASRKPAAKRW